jgi:hypothetical protein
MFAGGNILAFFFPLLDLGVFTNIYPLPPTQFWKLMLYYSVALVLVQYSLRVLAHVGCVSDDFVVCKAGTAGFPADAFQQIWELCSAAEGTDTNWRFAPRGQLCSSGTIHTGASL